MHVASGDFGAVSLRYSSSGYTQTVQMTSYTNEIDITNTVHARILHYSYVDSAILVGGVTPMRSWSQVFPMSIKVLSWPSSQANWTNVSLCQGVRPQRLITPPVLLQGVMIPEKRRCRLEMNILWIVSNEAVVIDSSMVELLEIRLILKPLFCRLDIGLNVLLFPAYVLPFSSCVQPVLFCVSLASFDVPSRP